MEKLPSLPQLLLPQRIIANLLALLCWLGYINWKPSRDDSLNIHSERWTVLYAIKIVRGDRVSLKIERDWFEVVTAFERVFFCVIEQTESPPAVTSLHIGLISKRKLVNIYMPHIFIKNVTESAWKVSFIYTDCWYIGQVILGKNWDGWLKIWRIQR